MPASNNHFAPVPARAQREKTLTALDHRVLQAIAYKDRFKAGGKHCFASHATLAGNVDCTEPALSKSISHLIELEYIERLPQEDRRRHGYRVIYKEEDDLRTPASETVALARKEKLTQTTGDTCSPEQVPATEKFHNMQPDQGIERRIPARNIYSTENLIQKKKTSPLGYKSLDHTHPALAEKFGGWPRLDALAPTELEKLKILEFEGRLTREDLLNAERSLRLKT